MPVRLSRRLLVACGEVRPASSTWEHSLEAGTRHATNTKSSGAVPFCLHFLIFLHHPTLVIFRLFNHALLFFLCFSSPSFVTFLKNIYPARLGRWISSLLSPSHAEWQRWVLLGFENYPKLNKKPLTFFKDELHAGSRDALLCFSKMSCHQWDGYKP